MSYRIGIDVGGTFTDFLVVADDGRQTSHKSSSTPDDPSLGVMRGLEALSDGMSLSLGAFLGAVELIVHGTTVATNALLTRRGARTGLICTDGFRDALALRNGLREAPYDNRLQPPAPLVPRHLRVGVPERADYAGNELVPLDDDAVREACEQFARESVQAVAISFLHAPTNPAHEQRALALCRECLPDAYLTTSSGLLSQVRYYDRTSTTVLNSYVGPIVSSYLTALLRRLDELRFDGVLLVMQSNGGVATPPEVSERAALSLLSGPASGPTAALWELAPHGHRDCITIDMGGTSFDAALVKDGTPLVMTDAVIDRWRLALPTLDIHTIGAGGGSIARAGEGGLLHVGPESAGAAPGPACYLRGGTEPTVTDADLLLGFIDERTFLGGSMPLDRDAAERAIERRLAAPLGVGVIEAAAGVYDLVNVAMATGVREVSVRRGLDPRDFPLVVAGGAGPVHAAAIARELGIPLLVIPRESAIFCAAGMLMSDFKHDFVRSYKSTLGRADLARLGALMAEMETEGRATLARENVGSGEIEIRRALDLRYVGQWHELTVAIDELAADAIADAFHVEHERVFGYASPEDSVELLACRVTVRGMTPKPPRLPVEGDGAGAEAARLGTRAVWSPAAQRLLDTPVYNGRLLAAETSLEGPAIVELANTTIVVLDGFTLRVDRYGSFVLEASVTGADAGSTVGEGAAAA